jgi:threonine dehydrogenase-like Zn-dependent dehydrogenase
MKGNHEGPHGDWPRADGCCRDSHPQRRPSDVLVKIRACGVRGSDGFYIARGGLPPREGATPLGHEASLRSSR